MNVQINALRIYSRILGEARHYWLHLVGMLALGFVATPLALLTPLPLSITFDSVLDSRPLPNFLKLIVPDTLEQSAHGRLIFAIMLLFAVAILVELQKLSSDFLATYSGEKIRLIFRTKLFRHLQRLSLAYHDAIGTGDSTYRVEYDASATKWIISYGITPFITAAFMLVGMFVVTARIDWQLALIALAIAPVLFFITHFSGSHLRTRWTKAKELESSALSVIQETLASLRVVKAFAQEDRENERFAHRSGEGTRVRIHLALTEGGFRFLIGLTMALGTAGVLFVGVSHVQSDVITRGQLLLIMGYLFQLYAPLQTISGSLVTLQSSLAGARRAFSLLDEVPEVPERKDARPLDRAVGDVSFQAVSFAYGEDRPVLYDVSFEIPAGTRLGIAGATGAGKTTLVSLLTRFYDPTAGAILLDGIDLREYKISDLRKQFGIVLQEPVLFSTSIAENIAYARPEASEEEIIKAAKAANAHDFITRLPDGYATIVGQRGMKVSGGERQRISLARAFLKDAPILILDEPTSSVDTATESEIMKSMELLMEGRTVFMIAHRLTTLRTCDKVLQIEEGRVVRLHEDVKWAIDGGLATSWTPRITFAERALGD